MNEKTNNTPVGQAPQKPMSIEELVLMPLSEDEARVQLADLDIQVAQCRQRMADLDRKMAAIAEIRAIIMRRVLNRSEIGKEPNEAKDGGEADVSRG